MPCLSVKRTWGACRVFPWKLKAVLVCVTDRLCLSVERTGCVCLFSGHSIFGCEKNRLSLGVERTGCLCLWKGHGMFSVEMTK